MTEFCHIEQLVKLFNPPRDDDDSDSDCNDNCENSAECETEEKPKEKKQNPYAKIETNRQENDTSNMYDAENLLPSDSEFSSDWKKIPKWNISYRQKVTASDVFLQVWTKV
jgi:hypothetical protein